MAEHDVPVLSVREIVVTQVRSVWKERERKMREEKDFIA